MQERINYQKIRQLADQKHSWLKSFFGVAVDVGDQGGNNRHFISNILFPLVPIALASISVIVAGVTALSTLVFGAMAFIHSAYQAKRSKEGMEERTRKLKKEIEAFEEEVIQLIKLYHELETQRQLKKLSDEVIDEEQAKIVASFRVLLDHIDLGKKSRSQKLSEILQHHKSDEIAASLDQIGQKMMFSREDPAIQTQLSDILSRIKKPEPTNPHIRRSLGALVLFAGFSLGFGLGLAAVSALLVLTFPWSILPAVGVGLVFAGIFFARYHFIKRGAERDQAEMKLAKGQLKGLKGFVSNICTNIKNKCANLLGQEAAKQEKAEELQAQMEEERVAMRKVQAQVEEERVAMGKVQQQMEEERVAIRKVQEEVERKELVLVKEKANLEGQKQVLDESQLKLYQSIKIFHEAKDQFENEKKVVLEERTKLQEQERRMIAEKDQLEEREALLVARENAMAEKERLVVGEKKQINETLCEVMEGQQKNQKWNRGFFVQNITASTNGRIETIDEKPEKYTKQNG